MALARAGLKIADELLLVLPLVFPHSKDYQGVTLEDRVTMLEAVLGNEPRASIAATEGGLFIEIARECRTAYGENTRLLFLCGRDAAERVVNWDYGEVGTFAEMLREFELFVAPRKGHYQPPSELSQRIHPLALDSNYDDVSGTEIRRRIATGEPWEHLVPEEIAPLVRRLYGGTTEQVLE